MLDWCKYNHMHRIFYTLANVSLQLNLCKYHIVHLVLCIRFGVLPIEPVKFKRKSHSYIHALICPIHSNICRYFYVCNWWLPFLVYHLTWHKRIVLRILFFFFSFWIGRDISRQKKTIVCQLTYELIIWSCMLFKSMYKTKQDVMKYSFKFCTEQTSMFFF